MPAAVLGWAATSWRWRGISPALLALVACLALPWTPFLRLGLRDEPLASAFLSSPRFLFTVLGLVVLGAVLARWDVWLGAAVAYVALSAVFTGTDLALASAHWFALGAGALVLLARAPGSWRPVGVLALTASALLEVSYAAVQLYLARDPLFFGWQEISMATTGGVVELAAVGTIGNPKYLAALLALVAPIAPLATLPVLLFGLVITESRLAWIAVSAGLAVRYLPGYREMGFRRWWLVLAAIALGSTGLVALSQRRLWTLETAGARLAVWKLALADLASRPLFGLGLGTWYTRVPDLQGAAPIETFYYSHSDWLAWTYSAGLVGLVLLGGWLWTRRAMFSGPMAPALASLVVLCAGIHVFHIWTLAPTALLVVGLGLARE